MGVLAVGTLAVAELALTGVAVAGATATSTGTLVVGARKASEPGHLPTLSESPVVRDAPRTAGKRVDPVRFLRTVRLPIAWVCT